MIRKFSTAAERCDSMGCKQTRYKISIGKAREKKKLREWNEFELNSERLNWKSSKQFFFFFNTSLERS